MGEALAVGAVAIANGLSAVAIGNICTSQGAFTTTLGSGANAEGEGCTSLGSYANTLGVKAIAIGYGAAALDQQIVIGTPANVGTTHLYGLTPGIDPFTVVSWTPGIALLSFGPCPGCAVPLSFSAEEEIFEQDSGIKRSTLGKLMALEVGSYRNKDNINDVSLGIFSQQVEEVFPELLIENPNDGIKYLQINKLIIPLLQQLQEHHHTLQDQQIQFTMQQEEIEELKEKCSKLEVLLGDYKLKK